MPRGRPTKYRPEFAERLIHAANEGLSLTAFAGEIGVHREIMWEWTDRFPEFGNAVKRAKAIRLAKWERIALNIANGNGTGGSAQSVMTIFGLKNVDPDEWREKTTVEHDISDRVADQLEAARQRMLTQLAPPVIDAIAEDITTNAKR